MIGVQSVVGGVVRAIRGVFPDYEVYVEEVEQGLCPPCFSVICGEPFAERVVGRRFFRRFDVCVYFYPKDREIYSGAGQIWDKLMPALELISVEGDLVRGEDLSTKIVDGVMVFCVSYGAFVYEVNDAPAMGELRYFSNK